jgi:hypothetical protein
LIWSGGYYWIGQKSDDRNENAQLRRSSRSLDERLGDFLPNTAKEKKLAAYCREILVGAM